MRGITSARDNQQVLPVSPRRSHQFIGRSRVVERDHQGARGLQVQTLQQIELRYITEIHGRSLLSLARHSIGIEVDRNIGHLVHLQQCRDGLPDSAEARNDHPGQRIRNLRHQNAWINRHFGRQARHESGAEPRQQRDGRHGEGGDE